MVSISKTVPSYSFGLGALSGLGNFLSTRRVGNQKTLFLVDDYFAKSPILSKLPLQPQDLLELVSTKKEPTTDGIDALIQKLQAHHKDISTVVGMGGGAVLDTAKAVSNLLTNGGKAEDYQGWDLLKVPGVFKIGIPTLSGTGAEASRTCVMLNEKKNLKLGMNSEFTLFNHLILDPELTMSVSREQYFYTGMDTYIHCIESLAGSFRNAIGDAFSHQALELCKQVFLSDDMQSAENRQKLMVASYFGGCAIANSYVGVVHPFSAALSVVLGLPHCLANCIVINVLSEFYPKETDLFHTLLHKQNISLPKNITANLTETDFERLYLSTIIHEKPLKNALGEKFKEVLTREKCEEIFKRM